MAGGAGGGISVRTDRRAGRGAAGPPGAGATAGPPLSPPAAPPAPAAAWASGPVSRARPWAPGASGEAQGALNFVSSPAARRASPSPGPPATRPQRAPARPRAPPGTTHTAMPLPRGAPPGNSRMPIGSGGAQPGAPRLAAEAPPAGAAGGHRAGSRTRCPPRVRAARARPRRRAQRLPPRRAARARLSPAPAGPRARCSQEATGPCAHRASRLPPSPPPQRTAAAGAGDPGERRELGALSRHLGARDALARGAGARRGRCCPLASAQAPRLATSGPARSAPLARLVGSYCSRLSSPGSRALSLSLSF